MYNITRNSNKYLLIIFPTSVAFAIDRIQRGYFAVPSSCSTGIRVQRATIFSQFPENTNLVKMKFW